MVKPLCEPTVQPFCGNLSERQKRFQQARQKDLSASDSFTRQDPPRSFAPTGLTALIGDYGVNQTVLTW